MIFFFTFILDIDFLFQELNVKQLPTEVPVCRFIRLTSSGEVIFILGNHLSKSLPVCSSTSSVSSLEFDIRSGLLLPVVMP